MASFEVEMLLTQRRSDRSVKPLRHSKDWAQNGRITIWEQSVLGDARWSKVLKSCIDSVIVYRLSLIEGCAREFLPQLSVCAGSFGF